MQIPPTIHDLETGRQRKAFFQIVKVLVWVALLITLFVSLRSCVRQIPPASVGVRFDARTGIQESLLKPQVLVLKPFEKVIIYPTSIRNATYTKNATEGERARDDSIKASTSDGSILPLDITVSYHVAGDQVIEAFNNFGTEEISFIQTEFIRWSAIYAVNVVTGTRSIFDLTSKDRAALSGEIKAILAPLLGEWGLTVDDVYLGEVYPNPVVRAKVDERIAAVNTLELAKVSLQRAKIDAETTLSRAQAKAKLNALLAQQGEKVLQLRKLELLKLAVEKWDGKAPLLGEGNVPFTNISPGQ
jgi:regulator of protease activity HflC (stomatin/prohibitin superfamily)